MRILISFIIGIICCAGRTLAQGDDVATTASSLQDVLLTLKQSVDKLSVANDQLAARDNAVKQQLSALQQQLGQMQAEGNGLKDQAARLRQEDPRRAQQIARWQQEGAALDSRIQKAEAALKLARQPPLPAPLDTRRKEKLMLMKMIYESQQRQASLHEAIMQLQQNRPLMPAADALARQELLKQQVGALQAQVDTYPSQSPSANPGYGQSWGSNQVHELEDELKDLERNYAQLKGLMDQMNQRAHDTRLTGSQHVEEEQLQGKIDELKRQGIGLMADMDDLRSQMVDLDKRKSRLEATIPQVP